MSERGGSTRSGGTVTRRAAVLLGSSGLAAALTACSTRASSPSPSRTGWHGLPVSSPAEPGDAPAPTRTPVGDVVPLPDGTHPWGVAVAPAVGAVYLAARHQDRLVSVDLTTHAVQTHRVPGSARMIDLAGPHGSLLLPAEDKATLYRLALPSLEVKEALRTRRQPHQAVQVGDRVFVTEEYGHAVRAFRGGKAIADLGEVVQPGGITAVGGRVAAVDVATNHLFVWDASTLRLLGVLPAGEGPSHVVPVGGSRVAVCDARGHAVLTYDLAGTPRTLGRAAVPGRAFWICADPTTGTVYTALADANLVAKLRVDGAGRPVLVATASTVQQPISMDLHAAGGMLAVGGYARSQLQLLPLAAFDA